MATERGCKAVNKFHSTLTSFWGPNPHPTGQKVYRHKRAGLIFPVGRIAKYMKLGQYDFKRLSGGAAIYMAGVLEYLVSELGDISADSAKDNNRKKIIPRDIMLAMKHDEEFRELLRGCWISWGGAIPGIHADLLPESTKEMKAVFI